MSATNLKYKDVYFDSDEEVFFAMWLEELKTCHIVKEWEKNEVPIKLTDGLYKSYTKITTLKTKVKTEEKQVTILRPSEYTADFKVQFNSANAIFYMTNFVEGLVYHKEKPFFVNNNLVGLFEVKPSFDQNNMERLFVNNQKFIWDKHQIFVNLVEPIELFKKTFLPLQAEPYFKYRKSPTGKNKGKKVVGDWKMDWIPKTINEFLNS